MPLHMHHLTHHLMPTRQAAPRHTSHHYRLRTHQCSHLLNTQAVLPLPILQRLLIKFLPEWASPHHLGAIDLWKSPPYTKIMMGRNCTIQLARRRMPLIMTIVMILKIIVKRWDRFCDEEVCSSFQDSGL